MKRSTAQHKFRRVLHALLMFALALAAGSIDECKADESDAAAWNPQNVPRFDNPTRATFREKVLRTSTPAVISGHLSRWPALAWDDEKLLSECGERLLAPDCDEEALSVHDSDARGRWGSMIKLAQSDRVRTLSDLLALIRTSVPGEGEEFEMRELGSERHRSVHPSALYLHDKPIDVLCPRLLDALRVPAYFPVDMLRQPGAQWARSYRHGCNASHGLGSKFNNVGHPSLFLGREGTRSGLHADGHSASFWMAVLRGKKRFRLVSPSDAYSFKPLDCKPRRKKHPGEYCSKFNASLFDDVAVSDAVTIWEVNVSAGEFIFIPERWAHEVVNLEESLAVSYNFVDDNNLVGHLQWLLFHLFHRDPDWQAASKSKEWRKFYTLLCSYLLDHSSGRFPMLTLYDFANSEKSVAPITWSQFMARNTPEGDPKYDAKRHEKEFYEEMRRPPFASPKDVERIVKEGMLPEILLAAREDLKGYEGKRLRVA